MKEEEKQKETINKISFLKKIFYSIRRPSKYLEMKEEGIFTAFKYLVAIILIFSFLSSIGSSIIMDNYYSEGYEYLNENLPTGSYSEGILTTDNEELITLENDLITMMFGGSIIVDTKETDETIISRYSELFGTDIGYVLLSDKIIVVNLGEEGTVEYTYSDFMIKYFGYDYTEFSNDTIISKVDSMNIGVFSIYIETVLMMWITYLLIFIMFALLITIFVYLIAKIIRIKYKFKEIFIFSIYSLTLPVILTLIYVVQSLFTGYYFIYFNSVIIAIATMYTAGIVYSKKNQEVKEEENK